tara:strand:+ start:8965 stop:10152 length:1188 start_codon:yes stop_codon:yes gene_type:complete
MRFTKEMILRHLSDAQIFRYYLGYDFKLGVAFRSPFRSEKNPSFNIYKDDKGKLWFNDFGSNDKGDCFDFIALKYNIKFVDVLVMIGVDFDISSLEGDSGATKYKNRSNMIRTHANKLGINMHVCDVEKIMHEEPRELKEYKYEVFEFNTQESYYVRSDYFWKKYGINSRVSCVVYNARVVKYVEFTSNKGNRVRIEHEYNNPIIMYKSYQDRKSVRFYRPFARENQLKHFGSIAKDDYFGKDVLLSATYKKDHLIFICAGQKDAICAHNYMSMTYGCSIGSEGNIISNKMIADLVMEGYDFDNIYIFYDNDKTGITRAMKMSEETGLKYINVAGVLNDLVDYTKDERFLLCKDLADICEIMHELNQDPNSDHFLNKNFSEIVKSNARVKLKKIA